MSKTAELVDRLYRHTVTGRIAWSETEEEGVFQTAFPTYAVRISHRPSQTDIEGVDYVISIFESEGRLIEEITDAGVAAEYSEEFSRRAYGDMQELHETARRQAMGVEAALDAILAELDDHEDRDGSRPRRHSSGEDDLPF